MLNEYLKINLYNFNNQGGLDLITISACLIVKDEEKILRRCLDCIKVFADEIIIVDTGSTDNTKQIAGEYTDKIYDFTWINDFSAARNESFSKATMDYIYVADADEVIDAKNINKILELKKAMLPEIEIVQMLYTNQLLHNTTYNYDVELRPKIYKRIRNFRWVNPIHESVELSPIIYDSDIEIIHLPLSNHAKRDFSTFRNAIARGEELSKKLKNMYAKELFIAGDKEDFLEAEEYYKSLLNEIVTLDELKVIQCVLVKAARYKGDFNELMKNALKNVANEKASAEVCYELGEYYYELCDYKEAIIWFYNAAYETESELNIHNSGDYPLKRLWQCYEKLGDMEQANTYKKEYESWTL